jgi:thymidylate synthase (FAD)
MKDEFYLPEPQHVCFQSESNKQGRSECLPFDDAMAIIRQMEEEQKSVYANYQDMLDKGVARELARSNLPLSLYTEWYWQIDLHNLFHFLRLRMDPHAQYEIRVFGEALGQCAKAVAPLAYEAFEEYALGAVSFSKAEAQAIAAMLDNRPVQLEGRALATFEDKVARLRAAAPSEPPEEIQPVTP